MKAPRFALVGLLVALGIVVLALTMVRSGYGTATETIVHKETIRVLLPAIAKKPWEEIVASFERDTGIHVEAAYGSTGWILSQLKVGHPADVVAVASIEDMEKAIRMGFVDPDSVKLIACTVPAIIVPRGNPRNITCLEDLAKPGVRIAIADPETVVVGRYAKKLLEYNHLWDKVKPNIVTYARNFADLVNTLITAKGRIDAIIAFHVAHYWYPNETELIWLPRSQVPCATCITIAVAKGGDTALAEKFIEYVLGKGMEVFEKYHYMTPEEAEHHALKIGGC
ncbi:molybdenum ABC transporter, periplasmic molybdate-binding protein [Pyrolobus fumarii 1A]|uniref:Molybdenum ABC transporter, periplasmic molybdate-binding protein n=1 Tax=Pyrolobus fumarii (strain DSM 11204 / 1A) TaxID=694429 RepID=G0EFS4_PYRF1|nr:molybdate ABC transporter substrate-binding protein [Pyrolobus fumarii]AEM38245.1 molybdenum ABC transporter, periplasmic molybdate-binding protein [Pyrolobus fumarii 1A]